MTPCALRSALMIVKEVSAKTILSRSKVSDYTINPYVGCEHNCTYCYARFMKRFTGHREPWGTFVDVKANAHRLLEQEVNKKKAGKVWISGICDPYQPIERKYGLTRKCVEILLRHDWPVVIQTKSPLVLRDSDLLSSSHKVEVGLTITTADDEIRQIFEPSAPSVAERLRTLDELHSAGIKTYAMIAPLLPGAENLPRHLMGKINFAIVDRMNYHYADWVYRKHNLEYAMTDKFFASKKAEIATTFEREKIPCQLLF